MECPATPVDEDRRLRTLRSLSLLDTPPEERFDRVTRIARRVFDVPIALFSIVDVDRQWFKSRQGLDATETSREISFCGHTILRDEPLVVEDARRDERFADNPLVTDDPSIGFYAGCPVRAPDGQKLGTLCIIDREPRRFSEEDLRMLSDLAILVEEELSATSLANTDALTGLANRRGFDTLAEYALRVAGRDRLPVAVVAIDLDGFKAINDELGHAVGDQALAEMAELLLTVYRGSDVVARLGGDEFAVLMTGIDGKDVERPVERLRHALAERNAAPGSAFELACSIGVATEAATPGRAVDELLEEADRDMYEEKAARKSALRQGDQAP